MRKFDWTRSKTHHRNNLAGIPRSNDGKCRGIAIKDMREAGVKMVDLLEREELYRRINADLPRIEITVPLKFIINNESYDESCTLQERTV